jgi:pSer/pThr/pTyr-binding forkhead associated (FHA) protein
MADTIICPICNAELDSESHECPRCGFKLVGKTQAFSPVTTADSIVHAKTRSQAFSDPAFRVVKGPQTGETFYLDRPVITIGRDPHCDIFLNDMTVSRIHTEVTISPGMAKIIDKGSLNGTWVDGKIRDEEILHDGTVVQIGTFVMVFQENPEL